MIWREFGLKAVVRALVDANMGKIGEAVRVLDKFPRIRDQFYYYDVPVKKLIASS